MRDNWGCKRAAQFPGRHNARAFTLRELLIVILVGGLLILVLAPGLQATGGRSKTQVCLGNLRKLGVAVRAYTEEYHGILPGPLRPAIHHNIGEQTDPWLRPSHFSWLLRSVLGNVITDRLITCPVAGEINPDAQFDHYYEITGWRVNPFHYALNNYGAEPYGHDDTRATDPPSYFGVPATPSSPSRPPVALGAVRNAAREWMIADAWHRTRANPVYPELQQEGTYQFYWLGEALPNFAPHERRGSRSYAFIDSDTRAHQSARIRESKSDGLTNTLYFDGHAAGVPPRTLVQILRGRGFQLLYGFRGTVNPRTALPSDFVWR